MSTESISDSMTQPQITVALPVYNGEQYIAIAIKSVLTQTFSDFELLIIDNCSTDHTLEIIRTFSDPRIRLIVNPKNLGMIGNWNLAVSLATGKYIKILSHDDLLAPSCLAEQIDGFLKYPSQNIGIVTCKKRIINESGAVVMPGFGLFGLTRIINGRRAIKKTIRAGRNIIGEPSVVLLDAKLLRASGDFEQPQFTPDIKMWFKILKQSNLLFVNKNLASYRISSTSTSTSVASTQGSQFVQLIHETIETDLITVGKLTQRVGLLRSHLNARGRKIISRIAALRS
jgi:glycosyltransferase involved in cell wall biosynthesis